MEDFGCLILEELNELALYLAKVFNESSSTKLSSLKFHLIKILIFQFLIFSCRSVSSMPANWRMGSSSQCLGMCLYQWCDRYFAQICYYEYLFYNENFARKCQSFFKLHFKPKDFSKPHGCGVFFTSCRKLLALSDRVKRGWTSYDGYGS